MGLDIYVRWGNVEIDEDGCEYLGGWHTGGKYQNEWLDQFTGFESAPYAGYLRESWGSLEWVAETAERYDGPNPYNFFPDWEGYNGEELRLENGNLEKVLAFRDQVLRPYLRNSENRDRVFDLTDTEVYGTNDIDEIRALLHSLSIEEQETIQSEREQLLNEYNTYRKRIADAIGFLNFVELHKDKPNLTVIFG